MNVLEVVKNHVGAQNLETRSVKRIAIRNVIKIETRTVVNELNVIVKETETATKNAIVNVIRKGMKKR